MSKGVTTTIVGKIIEGYDADGSPQISESLYTYEIWTFGKMSKYERESEVRRMAFYLPSVRFMIKKGY